MARLLLPGPTAIPGATGRADRWPCTSAVRRVVRSVTSRSPGAAAPWPWYSTWRDRPRGRGALAGSATADRAAERWRRSTTCVATVGNGGRGPRHPGRRPARRRKAARCYFARRWCWPPLGIGPNLPPSVGWLPAAAMPDPCRSGGPAPVSAAAWCYPPKLPAPWCTPAGSLCPLADADGVGSARELAASVAEVGRQVAVACHAGGLHTAARSLPAARSRGAVTKWGPDPLILALLVGNSRPVLPARRGPAPFTRQSGVSKSKYHLADRRHLRGVSRPDSPRRAAPIRPESAAIGPPRSPTAPLAEPPPPATKPSPGPPSSQPRTEAVSKAAPGSAQRACTQSWAIIRILPARQSSAPRSGGHVRWPVRPGAAVP